MKLQGIYFIYDKEELVYIGKTTNLERRFKTHKSVVQGRYYKFIPINNLSDMALLELAYIDKYKPLENKQDKFDTISTIVPKLIDITTMPKYYIQTTKRNTNLLSKTKNSTEVIIEWNLPNPKYFLNKYEEIGIKTLNTILINTSDAAYKLYLFYNREYKKSYFKPNDNEYIAKKLHWSVAKVKRIRKELKDKKYLLVLSDTGKDGTKYYRVLMGTDVIEHYYKYGKLPNKPEILLDIKDN